MKVALFVPAKEHSERVKSKNLRILDGEHLFKRKILQMLECKEVDEVWLDSESNYFHELTKDLPIKHLVRDASLANNNTDGHSMFANEAKHTDADIVVQVLCTAPFLDYHKVDEALKEFKKSNKTSLVAMTKDKFYEWKEGKPCYGERVPNSKDLLDTHIETMSFYAVKRNQDMSRRYYEDPYFCYLSKEESLDIDTEEDLKLAQQICAGKRILKNQELFLLQKTISSCMISDVCKDLGISHYLGPNIKEQSKGTFLGRAKTLKLKKLSDHKEGSWEGIFDALNTYQYLVPGDVIVVSTDLPTKAYFGDLNASFAVKSGAVGAVIDGMTRDINRVSALDFPVYAHGSCPDDIRYEGTFESMNEPVVINGVSIKNNDIVYADSDGVVCVPKESWELVLGKVKEGVEKEMQVKTAAIFGTSPIDVLNNIGSF